MFGLLPSVAPARQAGPQKIRLIGVGEYHPAYRKDEGEVYVHAVKTNTRSDLPDRGKGSPV